MKGKLKITSNGVSGTVQLNGIDVSSSLEGLTLRLDPTEMPSAVLDVCVFDLSADLDRAQLCIPDSTHELLRRFGWTAPTESVEQGVES